MHFCSFLLFTVKSLNKVCRSSRVCFMNQYAAPTSTWARTGTSRSWERSLLQGSLLVGCCTDNFFFIILMKTTELWMHGATRPERLTFWSPSEETNTGEKKKRTWEVRPAWNGKSKTQKLYFKFKKIAIFLLCKSCFFLTCSRIWGFKVLPNNHQQY